MKKALGPGIVEEDRVDNFQPTGNMDCSYLMK
jgi:hypothetical protein